MSAHDVPATVITALAACHKYIAVEAEYFEGAPKTPIDPGEPAGYEVFSATLKIDENLRGTFCHRITIWVESGSPIDVDVDPEWLATSDALDLDDESLREEITSYLNNHD